MLSKLLSKLGLLLFPESYANICHSDSGGKQYYMDMDFYADLRAQDVYTSLQKPDVHTLTTITNETLTDDTH